MQTSSKVREQNADLFQLGKERYVFRYVWYLARKYDRTKYFIISLSKRVVTYLLLALQDTNMFK